MRQPPKPRLPAFAEQGHLVLPGGRAPRAFGLAGVHFGVCLSADAIRSSCPHPCASDPLPASIHTDQAADDASEGVVQAPSNQQQIICSHNIDRQPDLSDWGKSSGSRRIDSTATTCSDRIANGTKPFPATCYNKPLHLRGRQMKQPLEAFTGETAARDPRDRCQRA